MKMKKMFTVSREVDELLTTLTKDLDLSRSDVVELGIRIVSNLDRDLVKKGMKIEIERGVK